jgi:Zn-dependent protease with chaperone function
VGAFLVRGGAAEVTAAARKALVSQGFRASATMGDGASAATVVTGHTSPWFDRVETHLAVETHGGTTLVTASFGGGLFLRIRLFSVVVALVTLTSLVVLFTDEVIVAVLTTFSAIVASAIIVAIKPGAGTPLSEVPQCYWVLSGAVIALVPLGLMLGKAERAASTVPARAETDFWEQIRKGFPVRLVSLARHHPLPPAYLAVMVSAFLVAGGLFLYRIHLVVLLCALPFLAFLCLLSLLPHLFDHKPGLSARVLSASGAARVSLLGCLVLLLFAAGFGLTVACQANRDTDNSPPSTKPFTEFRDRLVNQDRFLDDVRSGYERTRQLTTRAEQWAQKAVERSPNAEQYLPLLRALFLLAPAGLLGVAMWVFFALGFHSYWQQVTGIPESWQERVAQTNADWIQLPPAIESRGLQDLSFRIPLLLLFVLGAVINTLALAAALELLWIVASDHALLFPQSECLVSWFFVPFLSLGMLKEPADLGGWDVLARAMLLVVALPPLYVCGRRTLGNWGDWLRAIGQAISGARQRRRIAQGLRSTLIEMCGNANIAVPTLRVLRKETVYLVLRSRCFSRRPALMISTGAISQLTAAEMKAAIAHELGHARQNLRRLCWLRIISILGGYPPWFLLLLTDLRRMEEDADRFALQAGADPQTLVSAILKASNLEPSETSGLSVILSRWVDQDVPPKIRDSLLKALRSGLILDRFLFSDDFVGFLHPLPRDRIVAILGQTGTGSRG